MKKTPAVQEKRLLLDQIKKAQAELAAAMQRVPQWIVDGSLGQCRRWLKVHAEVLHRRGLHNPPGASLTRPELHARLAEIQRATTILTSQKEHETWN